MNRKIMINQKMDLVLGTFDTANLISIFSLFFTEVTRRMLDETARFVLFPVSATFAGIRAILAIRQAKLTNGKNDTLSNAIIETIAAIAIITATIGGFVAATAFAAVSPIIMTVTTAVKGAYHLGLTAYYLAKGYVAEDPILKAENYGAARGHSIATTALALITVAVATVMIAAKPLLGILAIVGGSIGFVYNLYHLMTDPAIPPEAPSASQTQENSLENSEKQSLTNSAKLHKTFQVKSEITANETEKLVTKPLWQKKEILLHPVMEPTSLHLTR